MQRNWDRTNRCFMGSLNLSLSVKFSGSVVLYGTVDAVEKVNKRG